MTIAFPEHFAPTLAALPEPPRAAFGRLASMAFRFVQLSATQPGLRPRDLDRSARRDLAATLGRCGLRAAGLDAWVPAEHLLDPAHADRAAAALLAAIELAGELGRVPVSVLLPGAPEEAGPAGLASILVALRAQSEHHGVPIADHRVPPESEAGPAGWTEIGIDPVAWLANGGDPIEALARFAPRLRSIRLADLLTSGLRGPIGDPLEARLDVAGYRSSVALAAWEGPVVVDARQWRDPWGGLQRTIEAWTDGAP